MLIQKGVNCEIDNLSLESWIVFEKYSKIII